MSSAAPAWANPHAAGRTPSNAMSNEGISVDEHESELFRPYSTLDEPVRDTIMRDVNAVLSKLKVVLQPLRSHHRNMSPTFLTSWVSSYYGRLSTSDAAATAAPTNTTPNASNEDSGANNNNGTSAESSSSSNDNTAMVVVSTPSGEVLLSPVDVQLVNSLKDWDLWGPLVLCLLLAVLLSFKAPTDQSSLVFAAVFGLVWMGSTVVTVNAQLLGGTISFFQSLCALGYSLFPLTLSALIIGILRMVVHTWLWLDLILIALGWLWAIRTSSLFVGLYIKPERRLLALYPVILFYIVLAWLILFF